MNDYKKYFPIFEKQPELVYLDSGATTLKPQMVIDVLVDYYTNYSANIHRGVYKLSEKASSRYDEAREKVARFIGAKPKEIIFTSGTTDSINMVAFGDSSLYYEGDEIVATEMEHHSNLVPWQQLALRTGAKLVFLERSQISDIRYQIKQKITKKTKILAITQVSNVLGVINPIKEIISEARKINPEIKVMVDGAQAVGHIPVDVKDMDCDYYAFSGHKMYGPTGVGVLYVKEERMDELNPVRFGGGMIGEVTKKYSSWAAAPYCFEAGTPPIAEVIGLGAAVDFLTGLEMKKVECQEKEVSDYLKEKLQEFGRIKVFSGEAGIVSLAIEGVHPHDVATILDRYNICVRSGMHCAMPLHEALGVEATTRASLGVYNTKEDVDALIRGLEEVKKVFK